MMTWILVGFVISSHDPIVQFATAGPYIDEKTLNSLLGMRSYQQVRCILSKATQELTVLDTLPD